MVRAASVLSHGSGRGSVQVGPTPKSRPRWLTLQKMQQCAPRQAPKRRTNLELHGTHVVTKENTMPLRPEKLLQIRNVPDNELLAKLADHGRQCAL